MRILIFSLIMIGFGVFAHAKEVEVKNLRFQADCVTGKTSLWTLRGVVDHRVAVEIEGSFEAIGDEAFSTGSNHRARIGKLKNVKAICDTRSHFFSTTTVQLDPSVRVTVASTVSTACHLLQTPEQRMQDLMYRFILTDGDWGSNPFIYEVLSRYTIYDAEGFVSTSIEQADVSEQKFKDIDSCEEARQAAGVSLENLN